LAKDLFAPKTNGHAYLAPLDDPFRWVVCLFSGNGASDVIQRANGCGLQSYYPLRFNEKGEPRPLWANYLFLEFKEGISIELCRTTSKFIRVVSARDVGSDISKPVLVPRNAIAESMKMITDGKFDTVAHQRQFYGIGSLVTVTEGIMAYRRVRLETDILPEMVGNCAIAVSFGNWRGTIELFKLAL
jgi:hypothetical protein